MLLNNVNNFVRHLKIYFTSQQNRPPLSVSVPPQCFQPSLGFSSQNKMLKKAKVVYSKNIGGVALVLVHVVPLLDIFGNTLQ